MSHAAGSSAGILAKNPLAIPEGINKRCDLPPEAYWFADRVNHPFARRAGYNTSAEPIKVQSNQFRIEKVTSIDVNQCDVAIFPEPKGAIVYQKVWKSRIVQDKLKTFKAPWLYDNRKLAWTSAKNPNFKLQVDLGEEEGRPGRQANIFTLEVKNTCKVRMEALKAYLEGKMTWDNTVLECMSFLDHVLRQGPSERMRLIKRTLFNEYSQTKHLNQVTEGIKGIYSAIRLNESITSGGMGLGVNVDVSNQTFWIGQPFLQLARNFLSCMDKKWDNMTPERFVEVLRPVPIEIRGKKTFGMSEAFKALRRLQNMRFTVTHRNDKSITKEYKVRGFSFNGDLGRDGANAKTQTFEKKMPDGSMKTYSIYQYYIEQYRCKIQHIALPLIETAKAGFFPMEIAQVPRFNPYPFKLDPSQTSEMIRFAVQRPPQRKAEVMAMVANLQWDKDRYLAHFGIKINPNMATIQAKLIKNPVIQFGNRTCDPKMAGRWDLRGMKFVSPNRMPLTAWAFIVVDNCIDKPAVDNFAKVFKTTYAGHGGIIKKDPMILSLKGAHDKIMLEAYNSVGNANRCTPQIMFFILRDKTAWVYDRLKKNAECRFAILTQMVQAQHVRKAQPQYCSNVSMKVNSKLGGQTSRIAHQGQGSAFFKVPTMMIGCDVSHGNTSASNASTAAMCVSMDKDAAIYDAAIQTNGWGVEIVQPSNMHTMLGPLIVKWKNSNKVAPVHVFYIRDGVSEGQFAQVMEWEVDEMRKVFKEAVGVVPKITVIIATKRHHIRFFPERGDRNGNCMPGTLVEREVTHPFHYDFYLCSHSAIQGTARPVHYNVLLDECGLKPDDLQRILYHQCYQYCRSTTPVSLHPAVYYAHLASARARHHENQATSKQVPEDFKYTVLRRPPPMAKCDASVASSHADTMPPKLLKAGEFRGRDDAIQTFKNTMWWV
ncbi:Protein argonaute [Collariella sp. IMI 366227]|nr:Protein argonaute [Collariella sp. IMI 366227]